MPHNGRRTVGATSVLRIPWATVNTRLDTTEAKNRQHEAAGIWHASITRAQGAARHSAVVQHAFGSGLPPCVVWGLQGQPVPYPIQVVHRKPSGAEPCPLNSPAHRHASIHRASETLPCPWQGRKAATPSNAQCTADLSSVYTTPTRTGWAHGAPHAGPWEGTQHCWDVVPARLATLPNLARAATRACKGHDSGSTPQHPTCVRPLPVS
jgi:hypothetical protein